jgi:hypothetical protein
MTGVQLVGDYLLFTCNTATHTKQNALSDISFQTKMDHKSCHMLHMNNRQLQYLLPVLLIKYPKNSKYIFDFQLTQLSFSVHSEESLGKS